MVTATRALAPASTPATQQPRMMRLYGIDLLRFVAAVGVVVYHFAARSTSAWEVDPSQHFPVLGQASVYFVLAPEMFFVVSGFVVLWTAWGRTPSTVIAARASRLFPPYWAALALTGALLLFLWPEHKPVSPGQIAVNATLLQSLFGVEHVDGVYWTLWAELRFYLIVVLLVAFGVTRRRVIWLAALWPPMAYAATSFGWTDASELLIGRYAPLFAGGMLLFVLFRDARLGGDGPGVAARPGGGRSDVVAHPAQSAHTERTARRRRALVPSLLLAGNVALAVALGVPAQQSLVASYSRFTASPLILAGLLVGCFVTVAVVSLTPVARLGRPFLATLGALTYPIYLIHQYWGFWTIDLLDPQVAPWIALAAALTVSMLLALVIHYGVERRATPVVRRWLTRVLSRGVSPRTASRRPAPAAESLR